MPNRLVREGFLDSEAINALSDSAECFYHRLLLAADDAGRMDGRVEILRSRLFPLDSSRRASDVEKMLSECVAKALVIPYEWKGQRFLQLSKWQRCSPCVTSKYPWRDGSFRIDYVKVETRDGEKDFAATSVPIGNPSARDDDGLRLVSSRMYGDGDEVVNEDGDEKGGERPVGVVRTVVDAYHRFLPDCKRCEVVTPKRKRKILEAEKLAKQVCREQGWEYQPAPFWEAFFDNCAADPWRAGKVPNPKNPAWKQSIDVLLRDDHFAAVMDEAITALKAAA